MEPGSDTSVLAQPLAMSQVGSNEASSAETIEVASLVRRTIAGDSTAFEQIILKYERRVLTMSLRLLGTMDDAQDAAQEVFIKVFKYIHRLDLERPMEPWLMRMTVNVCRDIGRKRQRRQHTFPEITEPEMPSAGESGNPLSGLAAAQRRQMLWKALNNLPEKERLAVVLRDIEGLSTSEVAAILQSSESTVRSQVSRARVRMKEAIDHMTGGV